MQLLVLKILDEKGYFQNIAFVSGAALRILYDLNHFSEDLDFSLVRKNGFSFTSMMNVVLQELTNHNLSAQVGSLKDNKAVASAFIKFDQLLFKLGIVQHKNQKLSVKFEMDQRPPSGFH